MEKHRIQNATILRMISLQRIRRLIYRRRRPQFTLQPIDRLCRSNENRHQPSASFTGNTDGSNWDETIQPLARDHAFGSGFDAWRGKWGTLMHILTPPSLFDQRGISYVDDSFRIAKFPGQGRYGYSQRLVQPSRWGKRSFPFGCPLFLRTLFQE